MAQLSVNLDLVAAMREVRRLGEPDPCQAAVLAELAGADGIAVQMQRHRRHVRDRDLYLLKGIVKTKLAVEIPPVDDVIEKILEVKPYLVTFVADHADTDAAVSPIDFNAAAVDFGSLAAKFSAVGVSVAFFIEPDPEQIRGASKSGASAVLINCSRYAGARTLNEAQSELDRIDRAVRAAAKSDLGVHCGRGVNYKNIRPLLELGVVDEFFVGYAICARALLVGFDRAVREMLALVQMPASSA